MSQNSATTAQKAAENSVTASNLVYSENKESSLPFAKVKELQDAETVNS